MMLPWNMKSFIKILEISLTHINIQTLVTIIKNKKKNYSSSCYSTDTIWKKNSTKYNNRWYFIKFEKKNVPLSTHIFGESLPELENLFHLIHRNAWNNYRIWKKYTLKYTRLRESIIWIRKCTEGLFQESL